MKPRNLFNVVVKIFGLIFLKDVVLTIAQLIPTGSVQQYGTMTPTISYNYLEFVTFILVVCLAAFFGFFAYLLLFKTNYIIDKLNLDKGFDKEEFSFNISRSIVLTIALIVIGGVILTDEIPNFIRNVIAVIQEKNLTHGMTKINYSYVIISAVKVVIGFLISCEYLGYMVHWHPNRRLQI